MSKRKSKTSQGVRVFEQGSGFRVVQRTDQQTALLYEALGVWRPVFDQVTGRLLGYRVVGLEAKGDDDLPHSFTTAAISKTEMEVNAMGTRASHTFRLSEADRLACIKNGRPPEDAVERTIAKVRVYPYVGGAKGDILKAWPK